jgi:hypothetical protein
MDNLIRIEKCKSDIKAALIEKGGDTYMDDVVDFSGYADKIRRLQMESGDTPSTPTPSADYIYTNAFLTDGARKDIANLEAYEIKLDKNNTCAFEITCPPEFTIYNGVDYDIVFTVEVPDTYDIIKSVWINEAATSPDDREQTQKLKPNPRYATITRNNVEYNSFIRVVDGGDMMNPDVNISDVQYIITIKKK